ncbi:hypothetical protein A4S06_02385 [Erysipelotrichaceae bacterium MTC7]|nr:hypothetical protein A4S06_02385 [Erysipelotrichaceae bacterium MTC7]
MQQFKENLQEDLRKFTNRILIAFFVLFTIMILLVDVFSVSRSVDESSFQVKGVLNNIFDQYEDTLEVTRRNENYLNYLKTGQGEDCVYQTYYSFNSKADVKADLLLTDVHKQLQFSTFNIEDEKMYMDKYAYLDTDSLRNNRYTTRVLRISKNTTCLVFTSGLFEDEQLVGYVSYFYNRDALNNIISSTYNKTAIVDGFGNVLASNSVEFQSGSLHRIQDQYLKEGIKKDGDNNLIYVDNDTYRRGAMLLHIVSLAHLNGYVSSYVLGIVLFTCFSGLTWWILRKQNRLLVENRVQSIEMLMAELEVIKAGDLNHRIVMHSGDEFENLANDINDMVVAIQTIASQNSELHYNRKMSEIKQLEAQLNPHFIYNTLETIRYTIESDPAMASALIIKLTKILRYSINHGADEVHLEEEIDFVNQYLDIMKYRYKERLTVNLMIDDAVTDVLVPKLLIQPLVENSIKYGYEKKDQLKIDVFVYSKLDYVFIEVHDNGLGIEPDRLVQIQVNLAKQANANSQFGLYNINRRLLLMYGLDSQLDIMSENQVGTSILIKIKQKRSSHV